MVSNKFLPFTKKVKKYRKTKPCRLNTLPNFQSFTPIVLKLSSYGGTTRPILQPSWSKTEIIKNFFFRLSDRFEQFDTSTWLGPSSLGVRGRPCWVGWTSCRDRVPVTTMSWPVIGKLLVVIECGDNSIFGWSLQFFLSQFFDGRCWFVRFLAL